MTTLQKTLVTATVAALAGTGIYEARQVAQLRRENTRLVAQQEQLTAARDTALATAAARTDELARLQKDKTDLLRLRNEVAALRRQTNEVAKVRAENQQLRTSLAQAAPVAHEEEDADEDSDPQRQLAIAKMNDAKQLVLGLLMHAADNQNRLPTDLSQTTNCWANAEHKLSGTNDFELVLQGSLVGITNPASTLAVREREAYWVNGKWIKTYGFADSHSEIKVEPLEGFEAWEREHIIPPPPAQ